VIWHKQALDAKGAGKSAAKVSSCDDSHATRVQCLVFKFKGFLANSGAMFGILVSVPCKLDPKVLNAASVFELSRMRASISVALDEPGCSWESRSSISSTQP
jgi:hypothetical protein